MRKSQAAMLTAPRRFELVDATVGEPGPGMLRLRVTECGICGSDVKMYSGGHPVHRPPLQLGHELVGEVDALPDGYEGGLEAGTPVVVFPAIFCGRCHACRHGREHVCPNMRLIGGHEPGGLGRYVLMPQGNALPRPEGLPADLAVLSEPLAVGVHAAGRAGVEPGETALVLGCGPIGLLVALALRAGGAERILIADLSAERLETARRLGFEDLVHTEGDGLPADLRGLGHPEGVDVVLECAGTEASPRIAMECLAPGGRLVLVGVPPAEIRFDSIALQRGERDVLGSMLYTRAEFSRAMELLAEGVIPRRAVEQGVIRRDCGLAGVGEAFASLAGGGSGVVKQVVVHDKEERG